MRKVLINSLLRMVESHPNYKFVQVKYFDSCIYVDNLLTIQLGSNDSTLYFDKARCDFVAFSLADPTIIPKLKQSLIDELDSIKITNDR